MKVRILIKFAFKYKKWNYINSHNPIKKKKKKIWLKLYLELWLRGFVNCLKRDLFLLLLKSPSYGQSNWGKLFFKALRSCPTLESLCYFVWGGTLWSFRLFGLLLLTRWGRIIKMGILGRLGDWRGYTFWPETKPGARMAGGKKTFSDFLNSEEASISARLIASSQVWAQ